jgi:transposase
MKRLLALCAILVIALLILGYFRDWYSFATKNEGQKVNLEVSVDKSKVKEDEEKAKEKLQKLGGQIKDEINKPRKD